MKPIHVAIIGGGITGLSAAYYLHQQIQQKKLPIRFTLVEGSDRLGGKIDTHVQDGYIIERGPDSFLERKKHATQLVQSLGLADQLVNNLTGQAYIYHDQALHPIPQGSAMGIPTQIQPFLESGLLTTEGKARALEELMLPIQQHKQDQSVGDFFRKRLGDEMVDRLIEPLITGVYGNPVDRLSLQATFPHYVDLLKAHGSLIKAMRATRTSTKTTRGMFQTVKGGLQTIVNQLERKLPKDSIQKGWKGEHLIKTKRGYLLTFAEGKRMTADAVILTTPHPQTSHMLQSYIDKEPLHQAPPTSIATVSIGFAADDLSIPFAGTGFIVPRNSDLRLSACTWVHKKWPHTTPKGKKLIRCFVGRAEDDRLVHGTDEELTQWVLDDLQKIPSIDIHGDPELSVVHRWKQARPAYEVGHQEWYEQLVIQLQKRLPSVYVAGSFYQGVGLPDCIEQGKQVAQQLVDRLTYEETQAIHST